MFQHLKNIFFNALENKSQTMDIPNVKRSMPPVMPASASVVSDSENEEEEPETEKQPTKETEEPITISTPGKYL